MGRCTRIPRRGSLTACQAFSLTVDIIESRPARAGTGDVLLCTDAAAEGLNFQFCGALVNYDMPWNPMRVEQRIGRIDRLGQKFETIRVVNLYYQNSVETEGSTVFDRQPAPEPAPD